MIKRHALTIEGDKMDLDQHLPLVLSLSSILLVQRQYYEVPGVAFLTQDEHHAMYSQIFDDVNPGHKMDVNTFFNIHTILEDFKNGIEGLLETRIKLLELAKDSTNTNEQHVILAVESLLASLKELNRQHITEAELSSCFIHSVMQALFTSNNNDKVARCFNNIPNNQSENQRPDYVLDKYTSYAYHYTALFGEVKTNTTTEVASVKDFYRLCLFSKQSLQHSHLNISLFFQAIGPQVTFYIMKCIGNITLCIEFDSFIIPVTRRDILSLTGYLNTLVNLVSLENSINNNNNNNIKTKSLPLEDVQMDKRTLPRGQSVGLGPIAAKKY